MASAPIILVPGFWLGAWAWDEVSRHLGGAGHAVTALTLPGLEDDSADRATVTFDDHVDAVCHAVSAAELPVVLVVHSGAGGVGYEVTSRMPERVSVMVYCDSGPAVGPLDPGFDEPELPFPGIETLAKEENLDGLSDDHLATFAARAVPEPGGALRGGPRLDNDDRLDVPTVMICTGFTADQYRAAAEEGHVWLAGLRELRNVEYIDLPTSHWPMWSRPGDLAEIIGSTAGRERANL